MYYAVIISLVVSLGLLGGHLTVVTGIAPHDRTPVCRTDFRYREAHDWIPYASNGGTWKVLIDQYDYQSILGEFSIPRGVWTSVSNSGGSRRFGLGSGGECKHQLRAINTYLDSNVDKWVITQAVDYLDAVEVIVNVSIRLVGCTQRRSATPPCINDFLTLHRYDTNTLSETERIKTSNYQPYNGTQVASRLQQSGNSDTEIVERFLRPQNFNYTYFGIQDIGTTGTLGRLLVYYKVCPGKKEGLVTYPEVPHPPQGSGSKPIIRFATCAENASPVGRLETYAYSDGRCVQNVTCACVPGYLPFGSICVGCPPNTYSHGGICSKCPPNSFSKEASTSCTCNEGYFRAPNETIHDGCTKPPAPIPDCQPVEVYDTSVFVQWTSPEDCGGRNDCYYQIVINDGTPQHISYGTTQHMVTGLQQSTTYSVIISVHNGVSDQDSENSKLRQCPIVVTTAQGSVFMLRGITYPNNTAVLIENIGEGDNALICTTAYDGCCTSPVQGIFFYPSETVVPDLPSKGLSFYTTHDSKLIRLNKKSGANAPLGTYRCEIPDGTGETQSLYITIATIHGCSDATTIEAVTPSTTQELSTTQAPLTNGPTTSVVVPPSTPQEELSTTQAPLTSDPTTFTSTSLPPSAVYLEINGNRLENGTSLFIEDIGEGTNALLCHTDYVNCCGGSPKYGEFYYPNNNLVGPSGAGGAVYRNRGDGFIRLNANPTSSETFIPGMYRCEIPDTNGVSQSLYINIFTQTTRAPKTTQASTTRAPTATQASTTKAPIATQASTTRAPRTTAPVDCGGLSAPENGDVDYSATTVGSLATYSCKDGYKLVGERLRGCFSNGQWSGSAPTCEIIDCGDLSDPENGKVEYSATTVGSVATYSCDVGYSLVNGSESRTCRSNERWSGSTPVCFAAPVVTCKSLDNPANGLVEIDRKGNGIILPGSVATYSCNGGYVISGEATRECGNDGQWSSTAPTCEVSNPKLGFRHNGVVYHNGSELPLTSLGEDESALHCFTDNLDCCNSNNNRMGDFFYPNGTEVLPGGRNHDIYRNRGVQLIRLNRRNEATQPTGLYTCRIPDADNVIHELVIKLT